MGRPPNIHYRVDQEYEGEVTDVRDCRLSTIRRDNA